MFQPLQKGGCGCPVSLRPTGDESAAIPSGALVRLVWGELPRRFSDRWCHWCPWLDRPGCKETAERTTGTGSGHHPWTLLDECCMETVSRHVLAYQNCRDLIFLMVFARDCRSFRFATMTWHEQKCFRHVVLRIGAPYHSLWHQISSYNFYHFLYLYMTVIVEYLSVFHNYIYIYTCVSHATLTESWFHTIFHPKPSLLSSRPAVLAWLAAKPRRCNSRIRQKHDLLLSCLIILPQKQLLAKDMVWDMHDSLFVCIEHVFFVIHKWWWFWDGRLVPMLDGTIKIAWMLAAVSWRNPRISTDSKRCEICWSPRGDI